MRRPSLAAAPLLVLALARALPASAERAQPPPARERRLARGGHKPYVPRELARWRVTQSTAISRHAYEGADVMRAYGRGLPRVIHVSLGTNDDPRSLDAFRAAIHDVMAVAGPRRCVVWANIVRPPVAARAMRGYNRALAAESRPRQQPACGQLGQDGSREPALAGG